MPFWKTFMNSTKRYRSNIKEEDRIFECKSDDFYQFGCEFEFYIDIHRYDFDDAIESIKNKITSFCDVDILVDLISLPAEKDKNHCLQIKPDRSLADNGIEISIPISTQEGVKHYIKKILPLIEEFGYTNEDTGLHFHISTIKKDGINFNFYLYMLMCHDKGLLSSWVPRSGYSQNVMDILSKNTQSISRKIKTKKGTIWNLEKIAVNHVEIKSIGGVDYHKQIDKILKEFDLYVDCFDRVLNLKDDEYKKRLILEHKRVIATINPKTKEEFSKAIKNAGIIA